MERKGDFRISLSSLGKLDSKVQKNKERRLVLLKKQGFNKEVANLSNLIVLFTHWQDLRKENTLMTTTLVSQYLQEIARRRQIDEDILNYLYFPELQDFVAGKLHLKKIKDRRKGVYFVFVKGKFAVYPQGEVQDILDLVIFKKIQEVSELTGMCASLGSARGFAKVVRSVEEMGKVRDGDILVMATTRPEHLPAMKRAAAIITDEGGVTSHAAITSRELGKPCIIGTKIATKVFKDGDLVEVDANKGVVRKIDV